MTDPPDLTPRGKTILSAIKSGRSLEDLAKATGLAPAAIGMEIARLQVSGYLTDDSRPTAKAVRVLRD